MAYRKIRTESDPILRKKSRTVENFDDRLMVLLDDMHDTLIKSEGIGLAGVQVGALRRVVVVDFQENGGYIELINPEIIEEDGEQFENEACLSLPGKAGKTKRPMHVKVKAQDRNGKWHSYSGSALYARCFCHEIDHLDGILYSDRLVQGEHLFETSD